jgi:hypothetical protein
MRRITFLIVVGVGLSGANSRLQGYTRFQFLLSNIDIEEELL